MSEKDARRQRRKAKAIQRVAARDGEVFYLWACCHLEITIGPGRLRIGHQDDCPALTDPYSEAGYAAKVSATLAVRDRLAGEGIASTVIADGAGLVSPVMMLW